MRLLTGTVLASHAISSPDARAICRVSHMTPTETITPTDTGRRFPLQRFAFTATDDCRNLSFSIAYETRGLGGPAHLAPRTGPGPQWYTFELTSDDLAFVTEGQMRLEWSIYEERTHGGWQLLGTMTNELDLDGDGATRTDGDHLLCDADPERSPFFPEVCGDHIDNDCDGVALACGSEDTGE